MTSKREEAKFEKGSPYLPAEENSKFFTMEGRFWAELIDLVGLGGGHILLAVGVRYSMYVRHTCIQCIRWYGFVLRYLLETWEEKIFICVPATCPATGEQPLGLRWSIACCCVYSECFVVWLWVRWIRTSDGDGYARTPYYYRCGGVSGGLVTGRLAASFRTLLTVNDVEMNRTTCFNLSKNWIVMMKYPKAYIKPYLKDVPVNCPGLWTCK